MRYVLNTIYLCLLVFVSPVLIYAAVRYGKYRDGLAEKLLGRAPDLEPASDRFWFHAVSVGEVNLLAGILDRLSKNRPDVELVISTTTKTGYGLAKKKYPDHQVFYCPLDFSWAVRNAFQRIKPTALILVELELWPNLISTAGRNEIPIAIINGRLSDRSTRGYMRLGPLMRKWMTNIALVTAQSETCASRFARIGVASDNVHTVGSMKFDGALTDRSNPQTQQLAQLFDIRETDIVFIAGSTQDPEEAMALSVFRRLAADFPQLRLILVPRHPERGREVASLLNEAQVPWLRRSEIHSDGSRVSFDKSTISINIESARSSDENPTISTPRILLVDTVGELGGWWGCAHIGFVGGSMGSRGGQNMIEPAAFGVATCFGPSTKNFRDVVAQLLRADAAIVVRNEASLFDFVKTCIVDESLRRTMGERARQLVSSQCGATEKTADFLDTLLSEKDALEQPKIESINNTTDITRPTVRNRPTRRRA